MPWPQPNRNMHANVHQLLLIMQHADYPHYLERLMRDLPLEVLQELHEASFTTEAGVLENAHLFAKMFVADCKEVEDDAKFVRETFIKLVAHKFSEQFTETLQAKTHGFSPV